jgi:hypothetical protein
MTFVCKYCENDSNLHTFNIKDENENEIIYYSCMSEAKDKNILQIIYHINGFLQLHHEKSNKTWSWIIDSKNFKFEWHFFSLFKELLKIYENYKNTLTVIKIINLNNFMKFFLKLCTPFMTKELKNKLIIL